jgi:hypothetical protein
MNVNITTRMFFLRNHMNLSLANVNLLPRSLTPLVLPGISIRCCRRRLLELLEISKVP